MVLQSSGVKVCTNFLYSVLLKGARGEQGPKGAVGNPGPQGFAGNNGADGPAGARGVAVSMNIMPSMRYTTSSILCNLFVLPDGSVLKVCPEIN